MGWALWFVAAVVVVGGIWLSFRSCCLGGCIGIGLTGRDVVVVGVVVVICWVVGGGCLVRRDRALLV